MGTINLVYYKNVLDLVMLDFFDRYNDMFVKDGDMYVFGSGMSKTGLRDAMRKSFVDKLSGYIEKFDVLNLKYNFVISSCLPKDNILLDLRTGRFSGKLEAFLEQNVNCRYILKEKDIKIDVSAFNDVFSEIFARYFTDRKNIEADFGSGYENLFFVQHRRLDCYMVFKILKNRFGGGNCVNLWTERMPNGRSPLVAVNDLVSTSVPGKARLSRLPEFKSCAAELNRYVDGLLKRLEE